MSAKTSETYLQVKFACDSTKSLLELRCQVRADAFHEVYCSKLRSDHSRISWLWAGNKRWTYSWTNVQLRVGKILSSMQTNDFAESKSNFACKSRGYPPDLRWWDVVPTYVDLRAVVATKYNGSRVLTGQPNTFESYYD